MKINKTGQRIKAANRQLIRPRMTNQAQMSNKLSTPRNPKFSPNVRKVTSNKPINNQNAMIKQKRGMIAKPGKLINKNIQKGIRQMTHKNQEPQKINRNLGNNELKKSNGLMSQITFSQKPNKSKLVSKHLLGGIDAHEYSLMTNPNEMSNFDDVQIEQNLETFKNNLIQQSQEGGQLTTPREIDEQRLQKTSINQFQPMQSNLIRNNPQIREQPETVNGKKKLRSTSNSTRFTKNTIASNLLKSDTKQKVNEENFVIYKTSDFTSKTSNLQSSKTLTKSKNKRNGVPPQVVEIENYNFEYSYQDPVYQVYSEAQAQIMDPNQGNYVNQNFSNAQLPNTNTNSFVFKNQRMQNQSGMRMQTSPMGQEIDSNSDNGYMIQNNIGYVGQDQYPIQNNMIYKDQNYQQESEDNYDQESEDQMVSPVMYQRPWTKDKRRIYKNNGLKKFRPHSNNARNIQSMGMAAGAGIWGMNKEIKNKFGKNNRFRQTSGLSNDIKIC